MDFVLKKQPTFNPNNHPLPLQQQAIVDFEKFSKMLTKKENSKRTNFKK